MGLLFYSHISAIVKAFVILHSFTISPLCQHLSEGGCHLVSVFIFYCHTNSNLQAQVLTKSTWINIMRAAMWVLCLICKTDASFKWNISSNKNNNKNNNCRSNKKKGKYENIVLKHKTETIILKRTSIRETVANWMYK